MKNNDIIDKVRDIITDDLNDLSLANNTDEYHFRVNRTTYELTTLIDKVREEAVVKAFNFIQSEVEVPCVTTTGDTDKDIVIWAKANGFVDAVTLLDKKVKEYLQSIKEQQDGKK